MFDPFKDYEEAGYLRNLFQEKDMDIVREMEHTMFRAGLDDALSHVEAQETLVYEDFLTVHRILFSEFYPWAGQDRAETAPDYAVSKAGTIFCHPFDVRLAIDQGLRIGQDPEMMRKRPGEVMGFFAYGHPFLDGNGRTMLIIHSELCHRAGFYIEWQRTNKSDYLTALTNEVASPGKGLLDNYLAHYINDASDRDLWTTSIHAIQGLDGRSDQNSVEGEYSEEHVVEKYQEFEMNRNRSIAESQ